MSLTCSFAGSSPSVILRPFEPVGLYAGHWGVDLASPLGSPVLAVTGGTVSFAGSVAGRRSVTVSIGQAVKISYSYLDSISVSTGQVARVGSRIGTSGYHGGSQAFHLSLRVNDRYVNPLMLFRCLGPPSPGLQLAPRTSTYPQGRVRNTRRNFRPTPHGASGGCSCGV